MSFQIIRNDITKVKADAIVNTANPQPRIGRGTDSAIYREAGENDLLAARMEIGEIHPGQAVFTDAFKLSAQFIIHTVAPAWIDGNHGERDILHSCYLNSLSLAQELSCKSIAFPLIAVGTYGFPKDEALSIAMAEIGKFLLTHEMKVTLVVFDRRALELSKTLVGSIEEFIDEHYTRRAREKEYEGSDYRDRVRNDSRRKQISEELYLHNSAVLPVSVGIFSESEIASEKAPDAIGLSLDEVVDKTGSSFQSKLFELIDARKMTDVEVYKKANIDRKVFSRIRCKADYRPKKKTAVALAIALELDLPTMVDLLSRAEIAFSPNSKFDLIITYFVNHKIYDIYEINAALFRYGQPILGE